MAERDIVEEAARVARIVVHTEIAYDIVDELASSPEKYNEKIYKLSRLVTKVYNDIDNALRRETKEREKELLQKVKGRLEYWGHLVKELMKHLESLDEKKRKDEVRRFAALAISPDRDSLEVEKILRGREEGR